MLSKLVTGVAIALIGGVVLAAYGQITRRPFPGLDLVQSIMTEDHGTYYRFKVKLTYKREPQDFDIVAGCNTRRTRYPDGGSAYQAGLTPTLFGRRMSDGKVLAVRPPNACRGETTANHRVRPDLLPIVVIYDNADRLDFGVAYLSEDAYENPLSILKFGGATIETATRKEFNRFRMIENNAVTRELYHSALDSDQQLSELGLRRVDRSWGHMCEGYERYLLDDRARSLLRRYWPEGQPKYWLATYEIESALRQIVFDRRTPVHSDTADRQLPFAWSFDGYTADFGLTTRTGGGRVSRSAGSAIPGAYYPAASDFRRDRWPAKASDQRDYLATQDEVAGMHIDFKSGSTKGFGYCYSRGDPDKSLKGLFEKRRPARVDDQAVVSLRGLEPPLFVPMWILERDEYAFHYFQIYLESFHGDV